MRVLLAPMGTLGDLNPFVGLGLALAQRGHDAAVLTSDYYRQNVEQAGLRCVLTPEAVDFALLFKEQGAGERLRPFNAGREYVLRNMEVVFEAIHAEHVPGETLVVAQGWVFGARVASEALGVPLATVHLQPIALRSMRERPQLPAWFPEIIPRALHVPRDWLLDRYFGSRINDFRKGLGLPPTAGILRTWWNSPALVIGFFPDWFAPAPSTWPSNFLPAGFSYYQGWLHEAPNPEIEEFLREGDPPILISHASNAFPPTDYFPIAIDAVRTLGRRGIVLTPHAELIPEQLPGGIRHFGHANYATLLPRVALHMHHGGMGTLAQALKAGIPQIVVPCDFDQPDNAGRLRKLGVSATVPPKRFRMPHVKGVMQSLLDSPQVATACRTYADRCREMNAYRQACDAVEQVFEDSQQSLRAS